MTDDTHIPSSRPLRDLDPRSRAILGVHVLFRRLEERMERIEPDIPLTKPERHLIITLSNPMRMGELAAELQAAPSSITAMADSLEAKGLLERQRDPEDRRAWQLSLTPEGRHQRKVMATRAAELFSEATGLAEKDIDILARLLAAVAESADRRTACEGDKA